MAISLSQARKILGKEARSLTDPELEDLLNQMYGAAELAVQVVYLRGSNKEQKVIDSSAQEVENGD